MAQLVSPPALAGTCAAFSVNPVSEPARVLKALAPEALPRAWLDGGAYARIHAHSPAPPHAVLAPGQHALLAVAVHKAFYGHCPLILSPDAIWVTIMQGLAQHCAQAGEAVRAAWGVTHEGKKTISIFREDDYLDGGEHDWPGVVTEFSDKIGAVIGSERLAMAECGFSTSSATDKVVSRVALLDCVQKFFELVFTCGCGIPWVALRGGADDWRALRGRASKLRAFDLDWWCDELEPLLDQFVAAAEGRADTVFWQSMCNLSGGSGTRVPISGWVQALYPYLNAYESAPHGRTVGASLRRNAYLGEWRKEYAHAATPGGAAGDVSCGFGASSDAEPLGRHCGRGVSLETIPAGLSCAPFTMQHLPTDTSVPMAFLGGIAAVTQDPATRALEVHTGWAVAECKEVQAEQQVVGEAQPPRGRTRSGGARFFKKRG